MTDIYIISGFLGSGKTTLIKTMVRSVFRNKAVMVIENDFGETGIDAGLLREYDLNVTSLSAGCICCSLTGDFAAALNGILKDYSPDVILVEPSGVGRLSDILKICFRQEDKGRLHIRKTITVVDIRTFDKYLRNYGEFFEDQIIYADLVLLSHQKECPDRIRAIEEKIQRISPEIRIEADFWDSIPLSVFRFGPRNSNVIKMEMEEAVAIRPVRIRRNACGEGGQKMNFVRRYFARDVFSSVTLRWEPPLTEEQLGKKVLHVVKHADGEILRGKGIVPGENSGLVFHFIPGSLSIEPTSAAGNQICFIGTGLDERQIRTLFSEEEKDGDTCMGHNRSAGFGKDNTDQSAD